MLMNRVVPVLLLHDGLLVKTQKFKKPRYIGDPINAVRIFNDKEVDELVILDMDPPRSNAAIRKPLLEEIASEAFMPIAYGGGVRSAGEAKSLVGLGIEKVVINTGAETDTSLIRDVADVLGSQAVVGGIDYTRNRRGKHVVLTRGGQSVSPGSPLSTAERLVAQGAGEIFLQSTDRDGTMSGFDIPTIAQVADSVPVPIMACGGAGGPEDLRAALIAGASAVAASSMFVFHGKHHAVLLTYPPRTLMDELSSLVESGHRD